MIINGINGANRQMKQMGMNPAMDSYSRSIQNQIAIAQKQLQEISSDKELAPEEKMKKRQEIQQQINDLNMQLRQHQMELRRERQQAEVSSMDDMPGGTRSTENTKAGSKSTGLSQANMTAMISADSSIKQADIQGSVATKLNGNSRILKSEIRQDQASGGDTQKKEEELAKLEQKAQGAASSQLSMLADAGRTMEEAAKADSRDDKENAAKEDSRDDKENAAKADGRESKDDKDAQLINGRDSAENVTVDIRL